jgi:hypothetical protein
LRFSWQLIFRCRILVSSGSKMPLSGLSNISMHPNDQGYAYMAGIGYPAIKDLLPK